MISLSKALIIPSVTEPPNSPRGLPITMAVSPTTSAAESPIVTGFKFLASTFKIPISTVPI